MNHKTNIALTRSNSWYWESGYLTIDLELFGKYLCEIFNKYLENYYYFQKFTPTIKTDKERPIWQQGEERKNLAIISPKLYDEKTSQNYNQIRIVHMAYPRPKYLQPYTSYSKDYPSMFSKAPINLDEKEFLLYFGDYAFENVRIHLGNVENGKFIPLDFYKTQPTIEIKHSNNIYPFVEDFIISIFNYKILNNKPILDQNDMELILEEFEIGKTEKLRSIVNILKFIQEESTKILLTTNNVEKSLKLKKC